MVTEYNELEKYKQHKYLFWKDGNDEENEKYYNIKKRMGLGGFTLCMCFFFF